MSLLQAAGEMGVRHAGVEGDSAAVSFDRVSIAFDDVTVLRDVSFTVPRGGTTVLMGGSGTGKSVILRLAIGLLRPDTGEVRIHGVPTTGMTEKALMRLRSGIGMLFQESALFDSLTVADNVGYRLVEESDRPLREVRQRVDEVLAAVGLSDYASRMPTALSGGQRRRVAIARAIAAWPEIVLWDDPTSGLDPITARTICDLMIRLRDVDGLSSMIATHQLPDAFYIATHGAAADTSFLMLRDARVYFEGSVDALRASHDRYLRAFLTGWIPPLI